MDPLYSFEKGLLVFLEYWYHLLFYCSTENDFEKLTWLQTSGAIIVSDTRLWAQIEIVYKGRYNPG
jgi:hypothetical protein